MIILSVSATYSVSQAVVRAHEHKRYASIKRCMKLILFFGTPHRGSEMADLATTFGRILKAGSLGTNTNTQLSKDLEADARILESINTSFIPRTANLRILTFFETVKMDYIKALVCKSFMFRNCALQSTLA